MKLLKKLKFLKLLILLIIFTGIFLRFYNLNWGAPYYFHPDERNMAMAVSRMKFPDLNPHFFAYGQFPLYLAYFTGILINILNTKYLILNTATTTVSFPQAIFLLRFSSALSQTLLICIIYLISKKIFSCKNTNYQILYTATATIFMPGLIQSAHFGTTESLLTLFLFLTVYFSLKIADNSAKWYDYIFLILSLGFSLGTKLTALLYFPIPIFALLINFLSSKKLIGITGYRAIGIIFLKLLKLTSLSLFIFFSSILISYFVSPYNLWQYRDFIGALNYETDVASGKALVFYTRQFINTQPILFQFTKIFPYAVGPVLEITGVIGFLLLIGELIISVIQRRYQRKSAIKSKIGIASILTFSFLIYFIPNAMLFSKWTRFMTPIFPFFAIFSAYFIFKFVNFIKKFRFLKKIPFYILHSTSYILIVLFIYPGLIFFYQVYYHEDIRLTASRWIYQNIPSDSHILSETGNVIDIPVSNETMKQFNNPVSFDFYHLEENPELFSQLIEELEKSDYIFIPSRRIFANYLRLPEKYPLTTKYYNLLFSGKLGFVKIKEFKRLNDEQAEETWSVFDHPGIRIYKKVKSSSKEDYEKLFH